MFEISMPMIKESKVRIASKGNSVAICFDDTQRILNPVDALELADAMRCEDGHSEDWNVDTDEYNCLIVTFGEWTVHMENQDDIDAIVDALRSAVKEILRSMGL